PRPPRRRRRARCSGLGSPRVAPPALPSFPPRRSSDLIDQGQRRIPVQFAKRVRGRRVLGGQSTYIPLKVNVSGVIPVIFATSVRSEEHTSELQSRENLVCRLLLQKKNDTLHSVVSARR